MTDFNVGFPGAEAPLPPQPKVSKKDQLFLPLPVQLFGADAMETVGRTLFSEKVVKPMSLLGYWGCTGVDKLGSVVEGVVDTFINEEAAIIAADLGEVAVVETFNEAERNQKKIGNVVQLVTGGIPYVSQVTEAGMGLLGANLHAAKTHVLGAKSVFDFGVRIVFPLVRGATKLGVRLVVTLPRLAAKQFQKLAESPAVAKEAFIEAADHMRGKAWRVEYATQQFLNKTAMYADQESGKSIEEDKRTLPELSLDEFKAMTAEERESVCFLVHQSAKKLGITHRQKQNQRATLRKYAVRGRGGQDQAFQKIIDFYNQLSDRDINKLTPAQYEKLSASEKLRVVQLVGQHAVTPSQRHDLRLYRRAIEEESPIDNERKTVQFVLEKFNRLSSVEQASVLDISRDEVAHLSHDEQMALLDFLIAKVSKDSTSKDVGSLKEISGKLHANQDCSTSDYKKIASCFKKCLSGQEKSAIRRLLHEQVVVSNGTSEELQEGIRALEEQIKLKQEQIEAKGDDVSQEDILGVAELIGSLSYLEELQKTTEIENALSKVPEGQQSGIEKQEYLKKIGVDVETEGKVYKTFDVVGEAGKVTATGVGYVLSRPLQAIGWASNPRVVQMGLQSTAFFLEHSQMFASMAKMCSANGIPGFDWLSSKALEASDVTIDYLIKAERQAIGLFEGVSAFQKSSWDNYVQPLLDLMKTAADKRPLAENLEPLLQKMAGLQQNYMQNMDALKAHSQDVQTEIAAVGRQFQEVIENYHKESAGHIIAFNYNHILSTVRQQYPELPEDSPRFLEKLFLGMERSFMTYLSDIDKAIPREGWFFPTPVIAPPDRSIYDVVGMAKETPLLSPMAALAENVSPMLPENVFDVTDRMKDLVKGQEKTEQLIKEAKNAKEIILNMQESWSGWFALRAGLSKDSIAWVEGVNTNVQAVQEVAVKTASTVQQGAEIQLEAARAQANFLTGYDALKITEAQANRFGFVGRSVMEMVNTAMDYSSGRLATRILSRFTARVLRRTAPHIAAYSQPFWYGFARGVEFTGEKAGSAFHAGLQGVGRMAQGAVNMALRGGYRVVTLGESYVDPARISNYQGLSKEEQSHIRYLVFQSSHSDEVKSRLSEHMGVDVENVEEALKNAQGRVEPRVADLILQGFDRLDVDEAMVMTPFSFESMDRKTQERVVGIIRNHETLTADEASNSTIITKKFNNLLGKERKELLRISVDEFAQLEFDEQQDIVYSVIHSKGYREKKYGGLPVQEAMNRQIEDFSRSQEIGLNEKELGKILAISSEMSAAEKDILTPAKLKSMGEAKALHLLEILEERGKLRQLDHRKVLIVETLKSKSNHPVIKEEREKALTILATLYNSTLEPFQRDFLVSLTTLEVDQLTPQERKGLVDHILEKGGEISEDEQGYDEVIIDQFNRLSIPERADWRQKFQNARKFLEEQKMDIKLERDEAVRHLRDLKGKQESLTISFEDERDFDLKVGLGVHLRDCERQIKEVKAEIKKCETNLERIRDGKPLLLEAEKVEEKEVAAILFSDRGEDGMIEEAANMEIKLLDQAPPEVIKSYLDFCKAQLESVRQQPQGPEMQKALELNEKVLRKKIEILEQKLPAPAPAPAPKPESVTLPSERIEQRPRVERPSQAFTPREKGSLAGFFTDIANFFSGIGNWFTSIFTAAPPSLPPSKKDEEDKRK